MTFNIARHAETIARNGFQGDVPAPPPPLVATNSPITSQDFALTDLGLGDRAGLTLHRIDVALPERLSRLQYRVNGATVRDLPQHVLAGTYEIEGLTQGALNQVEIRTVAVDPASGAESVGDWSPAKGLTPTRFAAVNRLSETVDPVADPTVAWDAGTLWSGALDAEGYARFTSAAAVQALPVALLPAPGETLLFIAELEANGAASTGLSVVVDLAGGGQAVAEAVLTWAGGTLSTAGSSGMAAVDAARVSFDAGAGRARLALVLTLPGSAPTAVQARISGAGSGFRAADLRSWSVGNTAWPAHEPWAGPSGVLRLTAPETSGFLNDTLELDESTPWGLAFTVFGGEEATSGGISARANALTGATVEAGGSGYADGTYVLDVDGGIGGTVEITVSGGAVTGASVVNPGRRYTAPPEVYLEGLAGGTGAQVSLTRAAVLRDFWPAVNDGRTRASWDGRTLGSAGFVVEGFVAEGQFYPAGDSFTTASGVIIRVDADGSWSARANGTTDGLAAGEGARRSIALVIGNGGTRALLDMPLGFTGSGTLPLRIVTTPRLTGAARIGETLLALPGSVEVEEGITPRASYQWFADGAPITGEQAPRLRLTPGKLAVGNAVSCRVTWEGPGAIESWETSARIVEDWKVVADGDALSVGALTPAGLRGVPVAAAGTIITAGDPSGHWALNSVDGVAHLRPAAGPATPGSDPATGGEGVIAGSYTLGLSDGRSLAVTVAANTITCTGHGDLVALAQNTGSALGQGVYGFSFASGITLALWNSGDWGGIDDAADPESRFEDLELVGSDADGGAGRVRVLPYDATEAAAVTGPLHFARVRNLDWQVDLDHAEQPDPAARSARFANGALVVPGEVARTVAFRDCRVRGGFLMAERLRRPRDPDGIVLGAGGSQMAGSGAASFLFERVEIVDTGAAIDADFGAIEFRDCRLHRMGTRPFRLGNDITALTLTRVEAYDAVAATPFAPGAWITAAPDGASGYAPVYRPGVAITIDDSLLYPGQSRLPALGGLRLQADPALPQGGEAAFGYVFSAVRVRNSLIVGGDAAALLLSSGEAGEITDSAFYTDARSEGDVEAEATHLNGFRPLGGSFALTRSVLGADALGAGVARTDAVTLPTASYAAALDGSDERDFAPLTRAELLAGFAPVGGGALDLGGGTSAGPIALDGSFKGAAGSLPSATGVDWGVPSYGVEALLTGIGWGAIPFAAPIFGIEAGRLSGPAPLFVWMRPAGVTSNQRRDDTYIWDFGEDYDFEAPPSESRAPRAARTTTGPDTCHLFQETGRREVTMRQANSQGVDRTALLEVDVVDPDDWYAGSQTMVLNPVGDSDFSAAPSGALQRTATPQGLSDALTHIRGQNRRLLLKAGAGFAFGLRLDVGAGSQLNTYAGAEKAILLNDGMGPGSVVGVAAEAPSNCVVANIYFDGGWDPLTGNSGGEADIFAFSVGSLGTVFFRVHFINGDGFGIFGDHVGFVDCTIENHYSYGMISGTQANAPTFWRGCVFRTDPSYATNDYSAANRPPLFGPIRALSPSRGVFTQGYINFTYAQNPQPALRLFSTDGTPGPKSFTVTNSHVEGGAAPLSFGSSSFADDVDVISEYFVVEGNWIVSTGQWFVAVQTDYGALRMQNNIVKRDDGLVRGLSTWRWLRTYDRNFSRDRIGALARPENLQRAHTVSYNTVLIDVARPEGEALPANSEFLLYRPGAGELYEIDYFGSNALRVHPRNFLSGPHLDPGLDDEGRPYAINALEGDASDPPPVLDYEGVVRTAPHFAGAYAGPGTTPPPAVPADVSNAALAAFFSGNRGGAWMADSFTGLWQDTNGTVPVTAVGQPVARISNLIPGQPDLILTAADPGITAHQLFNGQKCIRIDGAVATQRFEAALANPINQGSPFSYLVASEGRSEGRFSVEASPLSLTSSGFTAFATRTQHVFSNTPSLNGFDFRLGDNIVAGGPARDIRVSVKDGVDMKLWRVSPFGDEAEIPIFGGRAGPFTPTLDGVLVQGSGLGADAELIWFGGLFVDRALSDSERRQVIEIFSARIRGV
ncbi:MAG: hypothetical protein AAFP17_07040 [Pseudomonadota bacterium]